MDTTFSTNVSNKLTSDVKSDVKCYVKNNVKNSPTIEVKIPLQFDLKALPNHFKKRKKRGYDYYAYLVGLMVHKAEQRRVSYGTYFGFSSDVLRTLIGGDYNNYLKALLKAGYIKEYSNPYSYVKDGLEYKCKGTFKKSGTGRAKRYALNLEKIKQESEKEILFTTYTISDKKIIDKINTQRVKNTQRVIEAYPTAKRVFDSLKELTILEDEALIYLHDKYDYEHIKEYGKYLLKRLGKNTFKKFIAELQGTKSKRKLKTIFNAYGLTTSEFIRLEIRNLLSKYNSLNARLHAIDTLKKIANGEHESISISRDHKTGRLFHNLTMTPKDLKPFVRLCGQPLVEIDGSNAQWWLLHGYIKNLCNILDRPSFISLNGSLESLTVKIQDNYIKRDSIEAIEGNTPNYMLHSFSNEEDYARYKGNVERELYSLETMLTTGSFRNYFIEAYKKKGLELNPSEVKVNLIKYILFGNVNRKYYHDATIVKLFKERYPYLHQIISDLKTKHIDHDAFGYEMRDQWKCLALIMQSKEASIFVEEMMFTDAVFMTSHDAIVTNEQNISKVEKTLTQALKRSNTKMRLGTKYWVKDYEQIKRRV